MIYLHQGELGADMVVEDDSYGVRIGVEFAALAISAQQAKALIVGLLRWQNAECEREANRPSDRT